jgi:hypothetical protein
VRDRLLGEIGDLQSQEVATSWASGALAAKNRLTAGDAKLLEDAFEQRLSVLSPSDGAESSLSGNAPRSAFTGSEGQLGSSGGPDSDKPTGIDKSELAVAAPRRYRIPGCPAALLLRELGFRLLPPGTSS